jgi:hypothetical protein
VFLEVLAQSDVRRILREQRRRTTMEAQDRGQHREK